MILYHDSTMVSGEVTCVVWRLILDEVHLSALGVGQLPVVWQRSERVLVRRKGRGFGRQRHGHVVQHIAGGIVSHHAAHIRLAGVSCAQQGRGKETTS